MFKTKFLSGQATRRLTYTKYGQSTPSEHKKIENNQMPFLISHATWIMWFCLSLQHLASEPRPELEWTCPTSSFLEELQYHLRLIFLYSDDRILALEPWCCNVSLQRDGLALGETTNYTMNGRVCVCVYVRACAGILSSSLIWLQSQKLAFWGHTDPAGKREPVSP